ncbi:hypothetical protein [Brochothrix thermosphacta]|uniref:hypothetical protein n=1 Tax=Brochothrix thermosphacta TaxID=2756 RepID=UPI0039AFBE9C
MSRKVYACLLGDWKCLEDDPNSKVFDNSPDVWWREQGQDLFKYDYVNVFYNGKGYRIHPSLLQIVTES